MSEGDSIHRTATRLSRALGPGPLVGFDIDAYVRGHRPSVGEGISEVVARGKHLLMTFEGGSTLHTHLGMTGSWRVVTRGERTSHGPRRHAAVDVEGVSALCERAPLVELLAPADLRRHPVLAALGPDLCDPAPDLDEALERMGRIGAARPVGEVLLDQRVASGLGNVLRSEVLWVCGVDPFGHTDALGLDDRRRLLATGHDLLRQSERDGFRRTIPSGLAVYRRGGRRCPRCQGQVRSRRMGEQGRTVWWCPACQTL